MSAWRDRILGWMPRGTSSVAAGIAVNGLATYVFLVVPARSGRLDPAAYAVFSSLWFAAYIVGPGLFIPLEQELGRLVAQARAGRRPEAPAVAAALAIVAVASSVIGALALVAAPQLARWFFEGSRWMVVVLAATIVGTGVAQWTKGWLGGSHEFGRYGILVGSEGVFRAVAVSVLAASGVEAAALYAIPIALAPIAASALALVGARPVRPVFAGAPIRATATAMGTLALAQLGAQMLMNGVPLSLAILAGDDERAVVGRLGAALVLARVPLFMFQALQASLLPGLATMVEVGDWAGFGRRVRIVVVALAALGAGAVGGGALLGPWATQTFFGDEFTATGAEFASLTLAAVVIVLALVAAQAMIALGRHRLVALGWLAGSLAFVAASLASPAGLEVRALSAGIIGPVVSLTVLGWSFLAAEHEHRPTPA